MMEDYQSKLLEEKMDKQKLINGSLEILIKNTGHTIDEAKTSVNLLVDTIEDYESEGYIVLKNYKESCSVLKDRLRGAV